MSNLLTPGQAAEHLQVSTSTLASWRCNGGGLKFGSLFSGGGGLDLGLERAGMTCAWQVEIDSFARRVLAKHWPLVPKRSDVRTLFLFDHETFRTIGRLDAIDLLAGGFPCQDISTAGHGIGIIGERSGLWKEFARVIAELRPKFVFAENVPALRGRGLAMVLQDLWALGYDAEWHCIPACSLGAPHERDRIWIVAYVAGMFREAIIWGEPERAIRGVSEDADVDGAGLEVGIGEPGNDGTEFQATKRSDPEFADAYSEPLVRAAIARGERSAWTVEPGVVRDLYGFSSWLDGFRLIPESHNRIMNYGDSSKERSSEALRLLRSAAASEAVQWSAGGFGSIPSAAVLLTYLWKLSERSEEQKHFQLQSEEVFEGALRSMWMGIELDGSPYRPESQKQFVGKRTDPLQALSRFLAHDAEKAWSEYRRENARHILTGWEHGWESGFRRMAHGVPNRVDRLRVLGNAVVPQVAEWIGKRIMAAAIGGAHGNA